MSYDQAENPKFEPSKSKRLTRFLDSLGEAEIALQEYLADQPGSPDFPAANIPGKDYLSSLRERAEKARFDESIDLEGLSQAEINHLFHELQVHQVELSMQNEELRRIQLELEASRDQFSSLYDFAPVGYCTIDRKGTILEANSTLFNMLGKSRSELIQDRIQHYIDKEDQDRFYLFLQTAIKKQSSQIEEIQIIRPQGKRFTAQFESRAAPDRPDRLWLAVSDISNLKRGKEITTRYEAVLTTLDALEIERSRYRDLFELAPDSYFVTDENGIILDVNRAGTVLVETTKEQLLGSSLSQYVVPENRPFFFDQLNLVLKLPANKTSVHTKESEFQIQSKTMDAKSIVATAFLLGGKPFSSIRIRWLLRDVTLQKQIESALEKSQSRFLALFEESSIGIRLFDERGKTLTSNHALQGILGFTEEEFSQIPLTQPTDPRDRDRDEALVRSLLSSEIERYTIEKRVIRKDGASVWVHQVVFWVRDVIDHSNFIVAMTEDISERKQMENDLAEIRRRLVDRPEAERLYLSQELHDGPMQVLYGVSYKLKALDFEGNHSVEDERILSECYQTINQVIGELRGFASELRPPTLMTFGLEKAIRSHVEKFRKEHPELKVTLKLVPDGRSLPERVRLALFRIYQQSMANIIRHAHANKIQIRFNLDGQSARLEIEDNGCGFDVPERLVGLVRGGHLGLVGAAERAEAIGGKLTIASQPGKGTTILVAVNLAQLFIHEQQ
jgi:PAS domain S-box-containing protein